MAEDAPQLENIASGMMSTRDGRVIPREPAMVRNCHFESVSLWNRIKAVFSPPPRLESVDAEGFNLLEISGCSTITSPGMTIRGPAGGVAIED